MNTIMICLIFLYAVLPKYALTICINIVPGDPSHSGNEIINAAPGNIPVYPAFNIF